MEMDEIRLKTEEYFGQPTGLSVDRETFDVVKLYIQEGRNKMEIIRELIRCEYGKLHAISIWQNANWEA